MSRVGPVDTAASRDGAGRASRDRGDQGSSVLSHGQADAPRASGAGAVGLKGEAPRPAGFLGECGEQPPTPPHPLAVDKQYEREMKLCSPSTETGGVCYCTRTQLR